MRISPLVLVLGAVLLCIHDAYGSTTPEGQKFLEVSNLCLPKHAHVHRRAQGECVTVPPLPAPLSPSIVKSLNPCLLHRQENAKKDGVITTESGALLSARLTHISCDGSSIFTAGELIAHPPFSNARRPPVQGHQERAFLGEVSHFQSRVRVPLWCGSPHPPHLPARASEAIPLTPMPLSCGCTAEGRLLDGTVFDSSYKRGRPSHFAPSVLPSPALARQDDYKFNVSKEPP